MSKNVYSVSQVNKHVEGMFKDDFMLSDLNITGEVSNCKYNHTGHIYFTLKDESSSISCVMFAGNRIKGLHFQMKDGDQVLIHGYVGVYSVTGQYQVYARTIEQAGKGDLYQQFEKLKQELAESGMFDEMYKRPIPTFATKIGVVTAPTGAAIHDIIRVSKSRNPYVEITLFPAQVQGEGAAQTIAQGIETLDALGLDVIIVGRGGGSIEDLWAFNELVVAKAIFNAQTPIISAVGHEVDFTIADFVADKRAATPTHAAELANFVYDDFAMSLQRLSDRINQSLDNKFSDYGRRLEMYKLKLASLSPANQLKLEEEKLSNIKVMLDKEMNQALEKAQSQLKILAGRLDGLSPAKRLSAGFGYVTDKDNKRIDSVSQLSVGAGITVRMADGTINGTVTDISKD